MTVHVNPSPAEAYVLELAAGDPGVDFTLATAFAFKVKTPDENTATWAAVASNKSASKVTLTHAYESGDLPVRGEYEIYALVTLPDGPVRGETKTLPVKGEFEK